MPLVSLEDLAIAAKDILWLLKQTPERMLWSPGRAIWGIVLCHPTRDSANPTRFIANAIVSIDGCLEVAMRTWPSHYVAGAEYPLDGIVRLLAGSMRIARTNGAVMFTCRVPDSVSGDCCIVVAQSELPWLAPEQVRLPLEGTPIWRAPTDPTAAGHLLPIHPGLSLGGLRPGIPTAAEFFATIGEPLEMVILPDDIRQDRLVSYWRLNLLHERERLRLAGHPVPPWMENPGEPGRLAEAWVGGWRGPHEPVLIDEQVAAARDHEPTASPKPIAAAQEPAGDVGAPTTTDEPSPIPFGQEGPSDGEIVPFGG